MTRRPRERLVEANIACRSDRSRATAGLAQRVVRDAPRTIGPLRSCASNRGEDVQGS